MGALNSECVQVAHSHDLCGKTAALGPLPSAPVKGVNGKAAAVNTQSWLQATHYGETVDRFAAVSRSARKYQPATGSSAIYLGFA